MLNYSEEDMLLMELNDTLTQAFKALDRCRLSIKEKEGSRYLQLHCRLLNRSMEIIRDLVKKEQE